MVNEQTLHERIGHWRVVVLANQRRVCPETLAVLRQFVEQGGTLVVTDGALRPNSDDRAEIADLLAIARSANAPIPSRQGLAVGQETIPVRVPWNVESRGAKVLATLAGAQPVLTERPLGKGKVAYLALAGFLYPDEDGLASWLMQKLGIGPMVSVSGDARARHLAFVLRSRQKEQLVLHVADLTTQADGQRIKPNSSHQIDPVRPIPEIALRLALAAKPKAVRVVPATTRVAWNHGNGVLDLVLRDFQTHAAVILDASEPSPFGFLPANVEPAPARSYPIPPVIVDETFDGTPPGRFPAKPIWSANTDAKTAIRVAADPASSGNRVLEFVDAPDARVGFVPYLVIHPGRLDRGRARFSCDLHLEPKSRVTLELRDEDAGFRATGPSIHITDGGKLRAAGKMLATIPIGQWVHLELEFGLGLAAPEYCLTILRPGQPPERFEKLPYGDPAFSRCTWLGLVSNATTNTRFYIDNVKLERVP